MMKALKRLLTPNPFDVMLKDAASKGHKKILVAWNRGLGDIALGLYALVHRIREYMPDAKITFLTRPDLKDGFLLLADVDIIASPTIVRGREFSVAEEMEKMGRSLADFDLVIEKPDPTRWLYWQIGKLTPRLAWKSEWDELHKKFSLPKEGDAIGVHVQTETCYNYEKNWPEAYWNQFFSKTGSKAHFFLFGFKKEPVFEGPNIVDLRGKTNLLEMLSIIKNRCTHLVVPDSGVLSLTYYLDIATPLRVVSLWADPAQGILKQKVASPNRSFSHVAMIGKNKDTSRIPVDEVMLALGNTVCSPKKF